MIRTPAVLTLLRAAGLDFARVDMEHSAFSMETVADMATLARALDFPLVVRPPALGATIINYSSDAAVLRSSYSSVVDEIRRGLP